MLSFEDTTDLNIENDALMKNRDEVPRSENFSRNRTNMADPEEKISEDFHLIFYIASLLGLPVSTSSLSTPRRENSKSARILSIFLPFVRTVCIVMACAYNHLLWSSVALRTCNLIHCLSGYAIMLIFARRKSDIGNSVAKINKLFFELISHEKTQEKSRVKIYLSTCFAVIAVFTAFSANYFFSTDWDVYSEKLKPMVPVPDDSAFRGLYEWLAIFSFIVSYNVSTASLYITLFLCVNIYRRSGRLFALFEKKLTEDINGKAFTVLSASENVGLFRDILFGISALDGALNACALVIYLSVMNDVFNLLSVILASGESDNPIVIDVSVGISIASALIQFFFMTFSGESIRERNEALKNRLVELSDSLLKKSPEVSSVVMFNLLSENIKSTKASVTGFGYFTITKRFIPSAFGITVTYGVLLYQMGSTIQ